MFDAPEVPLDIREAMHDCILAIFWPKKKIIEFFVSVDCLANSNIVPDLETSRHMVVTKIFSYLSERPDRGFLVFQTMIDRLANWSYFDPYYFDTLAKLDRLDAQKKIARLRAAVDQRNTATQNRRVASKQVQKQHSKTADLSALTQAFGKLYGTGMSAQGRGRLFETFLCELFHRQSIKMDGSFRLVGEKIDGTFKFEGENYIVEAKWQDPSSSTNQLYTFAHKVDGKMHGRGLFISVNGFSSESIKAIVHGKHIQTMLMDGEDISYVLEERINLETMLDYKIRAAQTRGDVYFCSVRHATKV